MNTKWFNLENIWLESGYVLFLVLKKEKKKLEMNVGFQNNRSRTVVMGNWGLHVCSRRLLRVMSLTVAPPLRLEEPVGYIRWGRLWLECKHWHTWQCGVWSPADSLLGFWRLLRVDMMQFNCLVTVLLSLKTFLLRLGIVVGMPLEFLFWFLLNERLICCTARESRCDVAGCNRGQSFSWSWHFVVSAQLNGWPW